MWKIKYWYYEFQHKIYCKKMKRKYPDWQDDEFNFGNLKFIWAVKSLDGLTDADAHMHTMNDIEIDYDRDTKEYILSIETVYHFEQGRAGEIKYLDGLLSEFTKFMLQNDYSVNRPYDFYNANVTDTWRADSIPELYTRFRVFVEGYKAVYGTSDNSTIKHSKWEISCDGYYPYCLECGYEPGRDKLTDFCPKCGSRMDGKDSYDAHYLWE